MASVPTPRSRATGVAWALSLLTTLASVTFAAAAIAGWVMKLWPATPSTLAIAAVVVVGGPVAAALLSWGVRRADATEPPPAPAPRPAPVRVRNHAPAPVAVRPLTPEQQWGRALLEWRERPRRR